MKKIISISIIITLCLLFSISCFADSPITSTNFYNAYLDQPIVEKAAKAKTLDEEILKFLSSKNNTIDQKAAVINAIGWDSPESNKSEKYLKYILKKKKCL